MNPEDTTRNELLARIQQVADKLRSLDLTRQAAAAELDALRGQLAALDPRPGDQVADEPQVIEKSQ